MPIFEYRCAACGHEVELLVASAPAAPGCPECGRGELDRLLSPPSVISDGTRRRASQDIRIRNRRTRVDQADAEARRIEAHSDDHEG